MLRLSALLALAALSVPASDLRAQTPQPDPSKAIDGETRSSFVSEFKKTCFQGARADTRNSTVPDDLITRYCECLAEATADRIKFGDLPKLTAGGEKEFEPIVAAEAPACAEKAK